MDRVTDWGCDVANQVPADVASRAAAVTTASYRSRNAGSAALAASRAGSTRRNSSMGLCWVRRHSTGSSRRNSARALRFQLHDRLAAMAASRLMRSGTAGPRRTVLPESTGRDPVPALEPAGRLARRRPELALRPDVAPRHGRPALSRLPGEERRVAGPAVPTARRARRARHGRVLPAPAQ